MSTPQPPLYQARIPVYPRSVRGRFRRLKTGVLVLAYAVFFLLPWLRWQRPTGAGQAVLFDLEGRRFYLFDLVVPAQDIFWLAGLLIIAAMLLFFVTGLAGRVWCGYFCFQTLWTDWFMMVERWVQGDRPARMRLDAQPWGGAKLLRKGVTWLAWLGSAALTGLTFTLYWADAPVLFGEMLRGTAPYPAYFTTGLLTLTTFVMAGVAREQVCTYMCPYARFQSAMFNADTLIVAYDRERGEQRAPLAVGEKDRDLRRAAGKGDCIDCGLCVQVCPVGIDIRNGLQLECISCALCIDACDGVMTRQGWPPGLIRYTSDNALRGRPTRLLKGRTLGYGLVLALAIGLLVWSVATRSVFNATVEPVRQPLYVVLSDGRIQNSYEIKLNNKTMHPGRLQITASGLPADAELDLGPLEVIELDPEQRLRVLVRVRMAAEAAPDAPLGFDFVLTPLDGLGGVEHRRRAVFHLPRP